MLERVCRFLFFWLFVKPIALIVLGANIQNREGLPEQGPAILVANHNSHLDTLVLLSVCSYETFSRVRPVAAADYFLKNKLLAWFSLNILRIIPISRNRRQKNPLASSSEALDKGEILILFPEGSRGEPGVLADFKSGVARLAEQHPEVPVVPIYLCGLDRALPKGEIVLVPFFCDIVVGESLTFSDDRKAFTQALQDAVADLERTLQNV